MDGTVDASASRRLGVSRMSLAIASCTCVGSGCPTASLNMYIEALYKQQVQRGPVKRDESGAKLRLDVQQRREIPHVSSSSTKNICPYMPTQAPSQLLPNSPHGKSFRKGRQPTSASRILHLPGARALCSCNNTLIAHLQRIVNVDSRIVHQHQPVIAPSSARAPRRPRRATRRRRPTAAGARRLPTASRRAARRGRRRARRWARARRSSSR